MYLFYGKKIINFCSNLTSHHIILKMYFVAIIILIIIIRMFVVASLSCEPVEKKITIKFPMDWDQLRIITLNPELVDQNIRSPEMKQVYDANKPNRGEFVTMVNKIFETSDFAFIDNKFPYYLENNIHHRVLWLKNMSSDEKNWVIFYNLDEIKKLIEIDMHKLGYKEYLFYQNPPIARSIAILPHFHVFYR